jgi:hypothetical protein
MYTQPELSHHVNLFRAVEVRPEGQLLLGIARIKPCRVSKKLDLSVSGMDLRGMGEGGGEREGGQGGVGIFCVG